MCQRVVYKRVVCQRVVWRSPAEDQQLPRTRALSTPPLLSAIFLSLSLNLSLSETLAFSLHAHRFAHTRTDRHTHTHTIGQNHGESLETSINPNLEKPEQR